MRAAIKFTWKDSPPSDDRVTAVLATRGWDYGEQWNYLATQPVAESVHDAVSTIIGSACVTQMYYADHAWNIHIKIGARDYCYRVFGVPDEEDRRNAFCVWPELLRGCLTTLFAGPPQDLLLDPAREVIESAILRIGRISSWRWVTEEDI